MMVLVVVVGRRGVCVEGWVGVWDVKFVAVRIFFL